MANPERGEVEMVVAGETYIFRLPMPRLIELEQEFGREAVWDRWLAKAKRNQSRVSLVELRSIFYQALRQFHPNMTREKVGELMGEMDDDQLGSWNVIVGAAFKAGRDLVPKDAGGPSPSPSTGATS